MEGYTQIEHWIRELDEVRARRAWLLKQLAHPKCEHCQGRGELQDGGECSCVPFFDADGKVCSFDYRKSLDT